MKGRKANSPPPPKKKKKKKKKKKNHTQGDGPSQRTRANDPKREK